MFSYDLIGRKSGPFALEYSWKDIILYNLAVGAGVDELHFLFENQLKAIPTYGTIVQPISPISLPMSTVSDLRGMLHMENELIQHKPMDPRQGKLYYETVMEKLYDQGEGKGAKMIVRTDVFNEFGNLLYVNHDSIFSRSDGGWGCKPAPKNTNDMPDRMPDFEETAVPAQTQSYLYRLTGDFFPIHADPAFAKESGFERPIMHGLCSYGYACRMGIKHLFPGEPERLRRINACFMKSIYPGYPMKMQIWKIEEGFARFQIVNERTEEITIGKGILEWQ